MSTYRKTPPAPTTFDLVELSRDEVWTLYYAVKEHADDYLSSERLVALSSLRTILDELTDSDEF